MKILNCVTNNPNFFFLLAKIPLTDSDRTWKTSALTDNNNEEEENMEV